MRIFGPSPTADEIDAIARAALEALPEPFASHLRDVVLQVDEFAADDILASMGVEDPFDLTGIYEGLPLHQKSVDISGALPDRILLFRRPILDEWADGEVQLERLVRHILIHEAGHHFGFSDEDMHAIEEAAG